MREKWEWTVEWNTGRDILDSYLIQLDFDCYRNPHLHFHRQELERELNQCEIVRWIKQTKKVRPRQMIRKVKSIESTSKKTENPRIIDKFRY